MLYVLMYIKQEISEEKKENKNEKITLLINWLFFISLKIKFNKKNQIIK